MGFSRGGRSILQGRGEELEVLETEGLILKLVVPELMGMKNIIVLNDEPHHCHREKPSFESVVRLVHVENIFDKRRC